ncbi:MAG: acyl carrier protein [Candidatus Cloacimonetes bacterium]|nr:acyl carrier protein [Candidatus Cloacimonadota bacterium]
MKKVVFFDELKETLEIEDIHLKEDTILTELDEYDSLAILSIIALIDEKFNKKISGQDFQSINTVNDLMRLIGFDNFE